jgi:hypothetical protein
MPNPNGSKTEEELDEERREEEAARARQDPAQTQRMQDMEALEAARMARLHNEMVAAGIEPGFTIGEQSTTTPPPPAPGPREEDDTHTPAPPPPPAASPAPKAAPAQAPVASPAVNPQLLAQLGQEPIPFEALDGVKIKVKIDGEERLMTLHDVRRSTQLDGAAHRRLEQANQLLEQARQAASAPAASAPNPPVGVERKPGSGDSTPASVTEEVKGLVNALFVGDEEAASASLTKILSGVQSPVVDSARLTQQVTTNVKQQLSAEEAEREFRSAYPDIVGDPHLASAADRFYAEVVAENGQTSYADALAEAGTRTRAWMASKGIRTATEPAAGSTRQERLERKERATEKDVRGVNRTPAQQEERVPSPSETIAEMRKARGLE